MMNKKAQELGLKNTNFKNPHGLDTADHYSSSRDMALIGKELVKYPEVLKLTSTYEDYLRENTDRKIWLVNTNKLVRFYDGVDGLKTGFTNGAGYFSYSNVFKYLLIFFAACLILFSFSIKAILTYWSP